jgi:hypothetical protein
MDKNAILTRLHSLTGSLKPAPGSKLDELPLLQRSLLEQLAVNPDLAVSGNRTRQEFTQPAASAEPSSHLSRLLDQLTAQAATQAHLPRIYLSAARRRNCRFIALIWAR